LPSSATTPAAAAALVLAADSRFAGLERKDTNLIGGCCFYEVLPTPEGHSVSVEIGWGDCPAGCINRHHWFYSVTRDGVVTLDREDGPPVPAGVPGAGGTGNTGGGRTGQTAAGIQGFALAGPVCPVVTVNDPSCADRPVAGATVHVIDATGLEVAQLVTDAAGAFSVALPPGRYEVRADAVEGMMGGTPAPSAVEVGDGVALVEISFDTGIR
jgi:hypothetical protein